MRKKQFKPFIFDYNWLEPRFILFLKNQILICIFNVKSSMFPHPMTYVCKFYYLKSCFYFYQLYIHSSLYWSINSRDVVFIHNAGRHHYVTLWIALWTQGTEMFAMCLEHSGCYIFLAWKCIKQFMSSLESYRNMLCYIAGT